MNLRMQKTKVCSELTQRTSVAITEYKTLTIHDKRPKYTRIREDVHAKQFL
jgi:hypothetical protein